VRKITGYRSFTDSLISFIRGNITTKDIQESYLLFNCGYEHAFPNPDYIALEATWASNIIQSQNPGLDGRHLIAIKDLPENIRGKCHEWNRLVEEARHEGRVYFSSWRLSNRG